MKPTFLSLVLVLLMVVGSAANASPVAAPCAPGAAYDPACDVNHDGQITIADIQLTAGHWNQNGTWLSDNNHDHLGQTWTGNANRLVIQGSFPDHSPLELNNSAASGEGLRIGSVGSDGILINSPGDDGVQISHAGDDGIDVGFADSDGVDIYHAAHDGIHINGAGYPTNFIASGVANGFEIAGAQANGLFVGRADEDGVHVVSAGNDGVEVVAAGRYAGYFGGNIYVTGNCIGCSQANFAVNVSQRDLLPGDVVSIRAVLPTGNDIGPVLWQVMETQPGQPVVGVVAGRAELVAAEEPQPAEGGKRLVPRPGAARPGGYVTVVYSGPMQVRVAPGENTIAAGTRLTAAVDGSVRALQTRTVDGMVVAEGAPVAGVALDAPAMDGLVWALVNPQ